MITRGSQQGSLPVGWAEVADWTDPINGDRTRRWQGVTASLEDAWTAIRRLLGDIAYAPTVSVAGIIADITVVVPSLGESITMPPGDIAPPSFTITPIEYDIPVEQRYVDDADSASSLTYLPQLESALRSAEPDAFTEWWNSASENQRRVAFWRVMGVRTYKSNAYNLAVTRYLRRSSTAGSAVYANVNNVVTWAQLKGLTGALAQIPEPQALRPDGTSASLSWLVRPPRITLKNRWLEVSQNFVGAFRWPADFYNGGTWQSNVGPLQSIEV